MESQAQEIKNNVEEVVAKAGEVAEEIKDDVGDLLSPKPMTTPSSSEQPWQEWVDVVVDFLAKIPEQLGDFFGNYQKPLTTLGLILTAAVTVYVTLAVLDAINHIPLLSSILELVGLGYTAWFVTRYLLKASTREELFAEFNGLKQQIIGSISHYDQ